MRSGTHLMMDLIFNNVPAYRSMPLYVDLDQCLKQRTRSWLSAIETDAGQVIKTHLPLGNDEALQTPEVRRILDAAVVITVERDWADVERSLARWTASAAEQNGREGYDQFWAAWKPVDTIKVGFDQLFRPVDVGAVLHQVAERTGVEVASRLRMPLSTSRRRQIYVNKALTRVAGRRAPRVDTTIHTLKTSRAA